MSSKVLITRIVGTSSRKSLISVLSKAELITIHDQDEADLIPHENAETGENEVLVSINGFVVGKLPRLWCSTCNRRVNGRKVGNDDYECVSCGPVKLEDISVSSMVFDLLRKGLSVSAKILKYDHSDDPKKLGLEIEVCQQ